MDEKRDYKPGDTIYILVDGDECRGLMDDWLRNSYECDIVVKRSKSNAKKRVIVTKDLMWATRIIKWHNYEQVIYK